MTTSTKLLWHQSDRETPLEQERRIILQAEAAVRALSAIYDAELDTLRHRAPTMFGRIMGHLRTRMLQAQTLLEAYDYFLARCAAAGVSAANAAVAWDLHSSEAFESALVEAEAYGPNAMRMIDETILAQSGIPPHTGADAGEV